MEDSIKNQRDSLNPDVGSQRLVSFVINRERKCRGISNLYDGNVQLKQLTTNPVGVTYPKLTVGALEQAVKYVQI